MRASVLALLLAAPAAAADVFPRANELFTPLLADVRQIQLGASYYRHEGRNVSDTFLGHSWGLVRWRERHDLTLQWNLEAMAASRFKLAGSVNEFETVDFFANLPIEARRGRWSARGMVFHESSHLGDDYIRRTGNTGFRYSIDGVRAHAAVEPAAPLRLYAGGTFLLHTIPSPRRWGVQTGAELTTPELGLVDNYPTRVYTAFDAQWRNAVGWHANWRAVLGLRLGFKDALRSCRFQAGYFQGHSPYGQFFDRREHMADVAILFDF